MRECRPKRRKEKRGPPAQFWLLFLYIFSLLPLGLPYVNCAGQEGCLFYLRSSLWSSDLPLFYFCGLFPSLSFSHHHSGLLFIILQIRSDQISRSVVSDSLRPHESQHARPPCPSPTPGVHSDSRPSSQWCHPAISSSVVPFSSCPQSLLASESLPMSQLFASGGQSTGVSALASSYYLT